MKNIIRYTTCLLLAFVIGACRDEDKNPYPDFTRSSIPLFVQRDNDTGFVDYLDLDATTLSFDVDRLGSESVKSIDVVVTFNNRETGGSETVTYNTVTSFPQQFTLGVDELIGLFPTNIVTRDTLSLGDSFVVAGNLLLADGRYLTGGFSPSVAANHAVLLTYNVACASDLAGGYDLSLVSGVNGEVSALPNQTINEVRPGYYEISDISMDIFGPNFPIKYRFTDICGNLTAEDESVDFGPLVVLKFNPETAIDETTGEITFSIEYISPSCCGLPGVKTIFKATPR